MNFGETTIQSIVCYLLSPPWDSKALERLGTTALVHWTPSEAADRQAALGGSLCHSVCKPAAGKEAEGMALRCARFGPGVSSTGGQQPYLRPEEQFIWLLAHSLFMSHGLPQALVHPASVSEFLWPEKPLRDHLAWFPSQRRLIPES